MHSRLPISSRAAQAWPWVILPWHTGYVLYDKGVDTIFKVGGGGGGLCDNCTQSVQKF